MHSKGIHPKENVFEADIFLHRTDEQTDSPSLRAFKCVYSNVCSRLRKRLRYEARHIDCTKEKLNKAWG